MGWPEVARRGLAGLLTAVVIITACGSSEPGSRAEVTMDRVPSVAWEACGPIECALLSVPVDHGDPEGATLDLIVRRRPATVDRLGVLVVHVGGPGATARPAVEHADVLLGGAADRFDVVGLDSRGTQASWGPTSGTEPFDCLVDVAALLDGATRCDGPEDGTVLAGRFSTLDTIDDLDLLRRALGEDRIALLGWSYGGTVVAGHADRYPDRVVAVVADAPAHPGVPWSEQLAARFRTMHDRYGDALGDRDLRATTSGDGAWLEPAILDAAVEVSLYDPARWPVLRAAVDGRDRDAILVLANQRLGRQKGGHDDGGMEAQIAVRCSDLTGAEVRRVLDLRPDERSAGIGTAVESICGSLGEPPRPLSSVAWFAEPPGDQIPGLVIGAIGDPASPFDMVERLAVDTGWRLHAVDGSRHTSVGSDPGATTAAVAHLVEAFAHQVGS